MGGWGWGGGRRESSASSCEVLQCGSRSCFCLEKAAKGSVVPSRQPSCNLPNSSAILARLQIAIVRTERQKQRLYLHRIIALVMT